MKTKLFLLLLVLCVLSAQAQNLSVKGRVTDTYQEAIIAANVSPVSYTPLLAHET